MTYVGQARGREFLALLRQAGLGECTQRGELPPRRTPWFHDCGSFRDYMAGRAFDGVRWLRDQWRIRDRELNPDFIVCPDEVGNAQATFARSALERPDCAPGHPVYFVVQDGMAEHDVDRFLTLSEREGLPYAGIFVGGTQDWKWSSLDTWAGLASDLKLRLHVGSVRNPDQLRTARDRGAHSADSSMPLWERGRLDDFIAAAKEVST